MIVGKYKQIPQQVLKIITKRKKMGRGKICEREGKTSQRRKVDHLFNSISSSQFLFLIFNFRILLSKEIMPMLILLSLLFILLTTAHSKCTSTCVLMAYKMCSICYCQENHNFLSCTSLSCNSSAQDCTQNQDGKIKEEYCFSQCCGDEMKDSRMSVTSIQKCYILNEELSFIHQKVRFMVLGVIGLVIYLFVPLILYCLYSRRKRLKSEQGKVKQKGSLEGNLNNSPQNMRTGWHLDPKYESFNEMMICRACIQTGIETRTQCDHNFHVHCIIRYLDEQNCCPQCQKKDLKILKYFCRNCQKMCIHLSVKDLNYEQEYIENIRKMKCDGCKIKESG